MKTTRDPMAALLYVLALDSRAPSQDELDLILTGAPMAATEGEVYFQDTDLAEWAIKNALMLRRESKSTEANMLNEKRNVHDVRGALIPDGRRVTGLSGSVEIVNVFGGTFRVEPTESTDVIGTGSWRAVFHSGTSLEHISTGFGDTPMAALRNAFEMISGWSILMWTPEEEATHGK